MLSVFIDRQAGHFTAHPSIGDRGPRRINLELGPRAQSGACPCNGDEHRHSH